MDERVYNLRLRVWNGIESLNASLKGVKIRHEAER